MKLFFFFTLIFLLTLFGCNENGEQKSSFNSVGIISYLPEETNYILSIDLNKIYKAGYGKGLIDSPINENSGWLTRFMYETDLTLANGISGIIKTNSWEGNSLFVLFFDKNISRVKDHLQDKNYFQGINNEDLDLYKSIKGPIYFSLNDNILISGDSLSVIYLTSNLDSEKRKMNRLSGKINLSDARAYWFWADQPGYALPVLSMLDFEIPDSTEIISAFESMKLGVKFEDGILINSHWNFSKEKAAEELNQLLLKQIGTNIDKKEQEFYSDLNIEREERGVSISLYLTDEILNKLKNN